MAVGVQGDGNGCVAQPPAARAASSGLAIWHDPHRIGAFYGHRIPGLAPKDAFRVAAAAQMKRLGMNDSDILEVMGWRCVEMLRRQFVLNAMPPIGGGGTRRVQLSSNRGRAAHLLKGS